MREKTIEAKLVQAVRTKGGLAPKFTSPGLDGVPDRLVYCIDSPEQIGGILSEIQGA